MILYHGTNLDIASINLNMCRPYKDFGKGFYLTLLEEQARKMAYRVSKVYGGRPVINIYEVDDNLLSNKELSIKNFGTEITEEWADKYFELFADKKYLSNTVTTIKNVRNIDFSYLNNELGKRGFQISNGYGILKDKTFRIAHMADCTIESLNDLLENINDILKLN